MTNADSLNTKATVTQKKKIVLEMAVVDDALLWPRGFLFWLLFLFLCQHHGALLQCCASEFQAHLNISCAESLRTSVVLPAEPEDQPY